MEGRIPTLTVPVQVRRSGLYAAVGGTTGCRALSTAFYAGVAQDPILRPLFPGTTFTCAIEAFAAFLAQFLGGPPEAAQRRQRLSLRESHRRFSIGSGEREAWLHQMEKALDAVPMEEPVRRALRAFFSRSSAYLINQEQAPPSVGYGGDFPHSDIDQELAWRWEVQRGLDDAVAAVRNGDAVGAVTLARSSLLQSCFQRDRAVWATLLALMVDSGHGVLLDYVRATLCADPALVQERYSGRTLLHGAAAAGNEQIVALLLRLGADPNSMDASGHAPLYYVSNACKGEGGDQVVRMLVAAGAMVNAASGITSATALHMAARRGNGAIAEALLECGAAIEARDRRGDTPLRRAVNCEQTEVAALLLARGADRHAQGSRGLTPFLAAHTSAMKRLLQ
jgi:hemoglobin